MFLGLKSSHLCIKHKLCCHKHKLTSEHSLMCVDISQNVPTKFKDIAGNKAVIHPRKQVKKTQNIYT